MNIRVAIPLITIVATVITQVDSFFSERFVSSTIRDACNDEITVSRTHQSTHLDKTFYLLSDNHANSVITASCSGYVVAKHKTNGCNGRNIIKQWDATCGNVAFMPCSSSATLEIGTYFDICVAGFNNYKLVYDELLGYFKISNGEQRQSNHDIVHVKAHIYRENKIVILPIEHQDSDARRMRVNRERARGRHQLTFPTFENPNNSPDTSGPSIPDSSTFHLNIKKDF